MKVMFFMCDFADAAGHVLRKLYSELHFCIQITMNNRTTLKGRLGRWGLIPHNLTNPLGGPPAHASLATRAHLHSL